MEIYGNKLVNTKPLCISSSNFAEMLTMVNLIDFRGHSSKMGIIDKSGVRGDATLCVVIFYLVTLTLKFDLLLKNFNLGHNFLPEEIRISYCTSVSL